MIRFGKGSASRRILILGLLGCVLAVLFVGLGLLRLPRSGVPTGTAVSSPGAFDVAVEDSRKVVAFVESYGRRIEGAEERLAARESDLAELRAEVRKEKARVAALASELAAVRSERGTWLRPAELPLGAAPEIVGLPEAPALPRLQKVTLQKAAPEAEAATPREVRIPAGSFAEGTLLSGVYAPTEGGANPVGIRVDQAWVGPNRSRIPLQGAFAIGKAQGDANSTRVVIQLDRLSFVGRDGRTLEVPLNGYVADQDGVMGLAGQYVWRIQEAASLAAVTGGISAAADAAAQRETVTGQTPLGGSSTVVTGDLGKFALARGASRAADEVGKIVTRRLEEIVPAIYVPNAKRLTLVLIDGATLPGLSTSEVKDEASTNPFAGLDSDR